ncbi:UDP-glucose:glycoprotein glucosyltransferase, partial [Phenoliferia sp. Uapishka_3]
LPLVIFYADPTSFSFSPCFNFLYTLSTGISPRLQVALRWAAPRKSDGAKLVLSGYGAALDIKKSDYLAIDDRFSSGGEKPKDTSGQPRMDPVKKGDIEGSSAKYFPYLRGPCSDSFFTSTELGLRATSWILEQPNPLAAFTHLTSNFPLLASRLSTLVPSPSQSLSSEILQNQMSSPATGQPSFSINGLTIPLTSVDPFALLRIMRKERKFVTDIEKLSQGHFTMKMARNILSGEEVAKSTKKGIGKDGRLGADQLGELFDASDRSEGGGLILWWNNLEKDKRYATWSSKIKDLLRPVYPGQMSLIGRNLNNIVLVLDLARPESLNLITESVKLYVSRGIPIRFGVVPQVGADTEPSTMVASMTWYLVEMIGRSKTMDFLAELAMAGTEVTEEALRATYGRIAMQNMHPAGGPLATFEEVLEGPAAKLKVAQALAYTKRLGVVLPTTPSINFGAFFLNGAYFIIDDVSTSARSASGGDFILIQTLLLKDFTQNLQKTLSLHTQFLQQEVYLDSLNEKSDVNNYFYDLEICFSRRNAYIFPVPEKNPLKIVNLVNATRELEGLEEFHNSYIEAVVPSDDLDAEEGVPIVATIFVVADLESPYGRVLAKAALELLFDFQEDRTQTRICLIHNPTVLSHQHPFEFSALLSSLMNKDVFLDILPKEFVGWLEMNVGTTAPEVNAYDVENPLMPSAIDGATWEELQKSEEYWKRLRPLVKAFGLKPGESGLVVNGRIVGPFEDDAFGLEDIDALVEYELVKRINPVVKSIEAAGFDPSTIPRTDLPRLFMLTTSVVSEAYLPDTTAGLFATGTAERQQDFRQLEFEFSSYIGPNEETAPFEIAIIVDPVSTLAQSWAPIIETLAKQDSVHLRLYLNPLRQLTELPIKRFYDYTFPLSLEFDAVTGAEIEPSVNFNGIPEDVLLTFGMELQKSWLAFPRSSVHDLDNIRLADLPSLSRAEGVRATFELESIIVEGHARDMPAGQPPRGLQLELKSVSSANTASVDSLVMSNLGYFQLKANPGPWKLQIRPGKSSEVFITESVGAQGWKSGEVSETGDELAVTTLEGLTIYPRFRRKPGHEMTELLDESGTTAKKEKTAITIVDRVQSIFPFLSPWLSPKASDEAVATSSKKAEINIFTVASGLLYERMAFLMMVSVMRHTNSTVKFWFIQNFLSPSFKAFIPHMAREYGFEYELVTYKWPHWLRAQTEKQRTIWGYKILFLDVLFPLELDRVIFVDSDQIVRADLKELVDLDLKGAPYAYAPMGSDREETKGFRFWDSGYWKDHLRGRPYHISALYVVDLDRFRQVAAGDRLRQQYQGLSADPNSLSNLDQDLPNNMQAQIPIYTLDQSWLWCETWCSDESLATAKTIDLCNNPREPFSISNLRQSSFTYYPMVDAPVTHEPKLARAKRLIPEWTVYDDEVAALAARIAASHSSASASLSSEAQGGINAFSKKADELVQAVEQSAERDEFVESHSAEKGEEVAAAAEEEEGRRKDEL